MAQTEPIIVLDRDGDRATIEAAHVNEQALSVPLLLSDGRQVLLPVHLLIKRDNGTYYFPHSFSSIQQAANEPTRVHRADDLNAVVLPVVEEAVAVGKRWVETGRVRVRKIVREEEQTVDETLLREDVEVQRVPVNRVLDAPATPRQEGDTLVIPVMEEMLVVEKRLVLKEEIHVTRHQRQVPAAETVTVRKEEVLVERLEPDETSSNTPSG
ncbi:MAG: YsnF/AvaK domain-containing protein [Chloroflexi bacterium]|nr:YsnF/AvaK domain-containing protein [Chloroflexota bacterium]